MAQNIAGIHQTGTRPHHLRRRPSRAVGTPPVYRNLKTFLEHRGGDHSLEDYYGRNHYDDYSIFSSRRPGHISVRYILETGDLYAIDEAHEALSRVILFTRLQDAAGRPLPPNEVSRILRGWAAPGGPGRPISWFVQRLTDAAVLR